jgi:hypothetical protein
MAWPKKGSFVVVKVLKIRAQITMSLSAISATVFNKLIFIPPQPQSKKKKKKKERKRSDDIVCMNKRMVTRYYISFLKAIMDEID